MRRRIAYLLLVAVGAQLSTGCCLLHRVAWRIRSCHGCYPAFQNPGVGAPMLDGPVYGGAGYGGVGYGGPECASCTSGYGGEVGTAMPAGYPYGVSNYPAMPGVNVPAPPSVGLPMPAEKDGKKN